MYFTAVVMEIVPKGKIEKLEKNNVSKKIVKTITFVINTHYKNKCTNLS